MAGSKTNEIEINFILDNHYEYPDGRDKGPSIKDVRSKGGGVGQSGRPRTRVGGRPSTGRPKKHLFGQKNFFLFSGPIFVFFVFQ